MTSCGEEEEEEEPASRSLPWWIKWGLSSFGDTLEDWENFFGTFMSMPFIRGPTERPAGISPCSNQC
ncbi:hypothetical protein PFLUV_G00144380 [Perca fluviatilis]|uniref:Uncharacterized protein n=1 Tax=Perca fluviatilis TaxID=8168 RepID=A0A6A5EVI9_PERFL|nr:hypothetical protein PFLUV_G00144380 [Perca fluviatilis]